MSWWDDQGFRQNGQWTPGQQDDSGNWSAPTQAQTNLPDGSTSFTSATGAADPSTSGSIAGVTTPAAPGAAGPTAAAGSVTIDQLKQLVGNDWSTEHLKQILPQLKALGIEVQNQERGDLRPRFLLPGGEQWDFGPSGWNNSGHGIQPGFGAGAGGGSGTAGGGGQGGILGSLRDTPGYNWDFNQGMRAVQSSAFAKGTGLTGGTLKALMQYGQGLADNNYWNTVNHYQDAAKLGLGSTGTGS